jgi:hypothetical protein
MLGGLKDIRSCEDDLKVGIPLKNLNIYVDVCDVFGGFVMIGMKRGKWGVSREKVKEKWESVITRMDNNIKAIIWTIHKLCYVSQELSTPFPLSQHSLKTIKSKNSVRFINHCFFFPFPS